MVCYGVRTCEDCASLAILALTVAKKKRIRSRVVVSEFARLPDETATQCRSAINFCSTRNDKVVAYDTVSDIYRRIAVAVDTTIGEQIYAIYATVVTYANTSDNTRVGYYDICPY